MTHSISDQPGSSGDTASAWLTLGVAGLLGEAGPADIRRIVRMGFRAVSWHLPSWEAVYDVERLRGVRTAISAAGLRLTQALPPQYPSLVSPIAAERAEGVRLMADFLQAARRLGVASAYVRPGSVSPAGPWLPHRDNRRPDTLSRLVEGLRALIPHAESAHVPLALEAHALSPVYSNRVARRVLDEVGSELLRFNADPVNLIQTWEDALDPTRLVREQFELLGDRMVCAHLKDVGLGSRFVFHVAEQVPGTGTLDIADYLRGLARHLPDGCVLIEHLPAGKAAVAARAVRRIATAAGLNLDE